MHEPIKVLDFGYVRLVESWGHGDAGSGEAEDGKPVSVEDNECGVIEAARQSTQAAFRGWEDKQCPKCEGGKMAVGVDRPFEYSGPGTYPGPCPKCDGKGYLPGDQRLLSYLFNNKPPHATPFEFAGMVIEVRAPIFVFREWHRHRTQSYNEMSARYAPLPDVNYVPEWGNLKQRGEVATNNTQAKGVAPFNEVTAKEWHRRLPEVYEYLQKVYNDGLLAGVPKEMARIVLPVGRYSQMRASTNLRNWLAFLTLRADPGAMWEIQEYARAVGTLLAQQFPRTWNLFHTMKTKTPTDTRTY